MNFNKLTLLPPHVPESPQGQLKSVVHHSFCETFGCLGKTLNLHSWRTFRPFLFWLKGVDFWDLLYCTVCSLKTIFYINLENVRLGFSPAVMCLSSSNRASSSVCFTRIGDVSLPERVLEKSPSAALVQT